MSKPLLKSLFSYVVISVVTLLILGLLLATRTKDNTTSDSSVTSRDGKQIIELLAKSGYSPSTVYAQANTETVLRVKTQNTFDCSSSINIPTLGIRKSLPPTGTTDFLIKPQSSGTQIAGTCSMGMYKFTLNFN